MLSVRLTFIAALLFICAPAFAEDIEMANKQQTLIALNNEAGELASEIQNLERASAERAQKIKVLNEKIKRARALVRARQAEIEKVTAQAAVVEKNEAATAAQLAAAEAQLATVTNELNKVKADYAKADARGRAMMAKIEEAKKEELKRKAELTRRVANFEKHLRGEAGKRETAQQQVDQLSRENDRLYDRLKSPPGTYETGAND